MQKLVRQIIQLTALAIGAVFLLPECYAVTVTDDLDNVVVLESPAKRIIVLTPDLVEDLYAIGAGEQIVGVIDSADYPKQVKDKQVIGSLSGIDLETIISLEPDLIVTWKYAFARQVEALKKLGIPVFIAQPKKINDVSELLRKLGELTDQDFKAEVVAEQFEKKINKLRKKAQHKNKLRVLFLIDDKSLITVNHNSWINDVIELCGGENIYSDLLSVAPEVSRESILVKDPQVIIHNANNDDWQQVWRGWPDMTAVKKNALYTIQPDIIARAGPRLADGAEKVCDYLNRGRAG